jgi:hypothetical protein
VPNLSGIVSMLARLKVVLFFMTPHFSSISCSCFVCAF